VEMRQCWKFGGREGPALSRLISTEAADANGSTMVGWASTVHDALAVHSGAVELSTRSIHRDAGPHHSPVCGCGSVHDPTANHDDRRGSSIGDGQPPSKGRFEELRPTGEGGKKWGRDEAEVSRYYAEPRNPVAVPPGSACVNL
jgi:hypothetical protein